tara:strand:+ start:5561 stop:5881 length:321 start_codon:yes stop_codon:yes gene_type:complete
MGTVFQQFDDNDILIRLSPFLDEQDGWTGEVLVGIATSEDNYLSENDYFHIMQLGSMLCAAVPLMEESETFRKMLYEYTQNVLEEERKEKKKKVVEKHDNIIKVNF